MVFPITLSENARNKLGVVISVLCVTLAVAGVCLICAAIHIQTHINNKLILLESYNDGMLPNFLISVGTIMFIINAISAKFAYDTGFAVTSDKFRLALLPVAVVMFLFIWIILAASIVSFSHRTSVDKALHKGLIDAMKRYKSNINVKAEIDNTQMMSRCCGSRSYRDWFTIGWINMDYVNRADPRFARYIQGDDILLESVPFSCCDVKSRRPCVTADVLNNGAHRNYDGVTLYRKGCTDALMDKFEKRILKPTGSAVFILFCAQTLLLMLLRYLQTSVQSAYEEGDPEGPGRGSVLPNVCAACCAGDPDKYVKQGALQKMRNEKLPGEEEDETNDSVVNMDDSAGGGGSPYAMGQMPQFGGGGGGDDGGGDSGGGESKKNKGKKDKKSKSKSKSPKRKSKSPKRKSPKRKSPKRKSPKMRKSKSPKRSKGGGGKRSKGGGGRRRR